MICMRCGGEFDNPVPEVTNPNGMREIACVGWCSACNVLACSVLFRDRTAYATKNLYDPLRRKSQCR